MRIVLTGPTGTCGPHVLAELLTRSDARVACLVRATSPEHGQARIRAALEGIARWSEPFAQRIEAVPARLELPGLGLAEADAERIASTAELVIHSAAALDPKAPHGELAPANVGGTRAVLGLCRERRIPLHHVSTIGVFGRTLPARTFREDEVPPMPIVGVDTGYHSTKWQSEQAVRAAQAEGQPAAIHRLGNVLPIPDARVSRFVALCAAVGSVPRGLRVTHLHTFVPAPVVGRSLAGLALGGGGLGATLHHYLFDALRVDDLVPAFRRRGRTIERVDPPLWAARVAALGIAGPLAQVEQMLAAGFSPDPAVADFDNRGFLAQLGACGLPVPSIVDCLESLIA